MKTMRVKATFVEPVLGTATQNKQIYTEFIGSKAEDAMNLAEEVAALGADEVAEKGTTIFPRDPEDGTTPIIWNYQIEGFFKSACGFLRNVPGTYSKELKNYKKKIDGLIFVESPDKGPGNPTGRKIRIANAFPIDVKQRPLRAQTAQGERIALASSEEIPAGANITFDVVCYVDKDIEMVKEWLDFGIRNGLMQWRNSGHGRFTWEEIAIE